MFKKFRSALTALATSLAIAGMMFSPVIAQQGIQLPPGYVFANDTAGQRLGRAAAPSSWFDRAYCSTVGYVIARTTGAWTCSQNIPVKASYYGAICDSATTTFAAKLQDAVTAAQNAGGLPVELPPPATSGAKCIHTATVWTNIWAGAGVLAAPGMDIRGVDRDVTVLDTRVVGYAFATNPDWQSAYKSLYLSTVGAGGVLASGTYYIQITMTDPSANEVLVTSAEPFTVPATGRVTLPLQSVHTGYCYNIYISASSLMTSSSYGKVSGSDAICLGGNQSVNLTDFGTAHAVPTNKVAVWQQANFEKFSIINPTAVAGANCLSMFKVAYSTVDKFYCSSVVDGIDILTYFGDADGSFNVKITQSKFNGVSGWGINGAGAAAGLSYLFVENVICNLCGTLPANYLPPSLYGSGFGISTISRASPNVMTTAAPHTLQTNDEIYISGVFGSMTQLVNGWYRVNVTGASTLNLEDLVTGTIIDTSGFTPYTTGGAFALAWRPPTQTTGSGGFAWGGLSATFKHSGCTQANGTCFYATEVVGSNNLKLDNFTAENTLGKGYYIGSLAGGEFSGIEVLSAVAYGQTHAGMQLGTGFAAGGVSNVTVSSAKVRSDVTIAIGFEQFRNTNNPTAFTDSNRVRNVTWTTYDVAATQERFRNFTFDPIVGQVQALISAVNTAQLIPVGYGGCLPIHLKAMGEWVCVRIPSTGTTQAGLGGLSANTTYQLFAYNSAATNSPYVISMEASATGVALDAAGYYVKSSDSTRTFVLQAKTDGSGNFQTSGTQVTFFPVQTTTPIVFSSGSISCPTCAVTGTTITGAYGITGGGDLSANRTLGVNLTTVSNSIGGNVAMNNTANYFDGPSVAQGSTGTWDFTGGVSVTDTGVGANIVCKLWDGTTVVDSKSVTTTAVGQNLTMSLSGTIASPAANGRISCRDTTATTGLILSNASGNSKDSTLKATRIQ